MAGNGHGFERLTLSGLGAMLSLFVGAALLFPVTGGSSAPKTVIQSMTTVSLFARDAEGVSWSRARIRNTDSALSLTDLVDAYGMTGLEPVQFTDLEHGLPRVFTRNMPWGLGRLRDMRLRQTLFLYALAPLVVDENEKLLEQRRRLWSLHVRQARGMEMDPLDHLWLAAMARRYRVAAGDLEALFARLDRVPPSWVLAMAGLHGRWGQSMPFLPVDTDSRAPLRQFVRDYLILINSDPQYEDFRRIRRDARKAGKAAPDQNLVSALRTTIGNPLGLDTVIEMHALDAVNGLQLASDSAF